MVTSAPLLSSAVCRNRSSTIIPNWLWPGFAVTVHASELALSPGSSVTIYSATALAVPAHLPARLRRGGNDKGNVENLVKTGRLRFLTPVPVAASFEDVNAGLVAACQADQTRYADRQPKTIGERSCRVPPLASCPVRGVRGVSGPCQLDVAGSLSQQ